MTGGCQDIRLLPAPEMLRMFAGMLIEAGLSRDVIRKMIGMPDAPCLS
ncbi:MAG: hypothetical protein ACOY30_04665 [Bacillota bacterium]